MKNLLQAVVLLVLATPALGTPPFYVHDVREVCQFPRPSNNAMVLGHDNGSSVLFNNKSYWFFADSWWDASNDGALDFTEDAGGFLVRGTVAVTTDLVAGDGVDMSYRESFGFPMTLFPASAMKADECLLWPGGAVVANNTLYVFGLAAKKSGFECPVAFESFLASVNPNTLEATRLPFTLQGVFGPHFTQPLRISEPDGGGGQISWIYMVGSVQAFGITGYRLARVLEAAITDPAQYQYWNGSTWVVNNPSASASIFGEILGLGPIGSLAYNEYLGRYLMVYSCDAVTSLCARTTNTPGPNPSALVGAWSERVTLYHCPGGAGLTCYAGYQHPEYGNGATLYVTTARLTPPGQSCEADADCFCAGDPAPANECIEGSCTTPNLQDRYSIRMREIAIGTTPPPAGRVLADAARDYSPADRCGAFQNNTDPELPNGWSYQRLHMGDVGPLTFDYLWNWRGNTAVQGTPAPRMDEDTGFPGLGQQAVRVWTAPGSGTARVSGEIRKRFLCGNTAIAEILRIRNDEPVGPPLWTTTLSPTLRSVVYDQTIAVQAGDSLGFSVKRGGQSAICDDLFFAPTVTFTP